jgi:hypothetical protein
VVKKTPTLLKSLLPTPPSIYCRGDCDSHIHAMRAIEGNDVIDVFNSVIMP